MFRGIYSFILMPENQFKVNTQTKLDQVDKFYPAALIALRFLQRANLIKFSSLFYEEKKLEHGTMITPSSKAI